MDSSPPTLYKYFGPGRVSVLQNCLVRYSPLGAFNDPFEGRPEVTSLTTETGARDSLSAMLPQETRSAYDQLPAEARAMLSYELWEQLLAQEMISKEPELIQAMLGLTPMLRSLITQKFDQLLGALCLSEIPDSLLMWSHMARAMLVLYSPSMRAIPTFMKRRGRKMNSGICAASCIAKHGPVRPSLSSTAWTSFWSKVGTGHTSGSGESSAHCRKQKSFTPASPLAFIYFPFRQAP